MWFENSEYSEAFADMLSLLLIPCLYVRLISKHCVFKVFGVCDLYVLILIVAFKTTQNVSFYFYFFPLLFF